MKTLKVFGVMIALAAVAGPVSADITVVRNSCDTPHTVEVVSMSINTFEYTFERLPNGPNYIFAGIVNPTSTSHTRRFVVPSGSYRLTYRLPNSTPVGAYGQNVVIRPHHRVGGVCVPIDPRTRRAAPVAPVQ
ncbi:hypothetical protein [Brevundimonas sp. TWP2-3-4b1]|uniref:hypothetical protein n=1 Tax=Brevundimonas sp. TWP2-3-4b1 TaxID=2804580 RepID=UPI003CE7255F